jgi:3-oxoacyl-(acyl-carrier-protein) synthase
MDDIVISSANTVTDDEPGVSRAGARFGRLDSASQLVFLAVESLGIDFKAFPPDRIGVCLAAPAGSLATDLEFWRGRDAVGGPSPTLFAYTLPSAAIGVIAIRHGITGPNLCLVGEDCILCEARDMLLRGEVEACLCLSCNVVTPELGAMIQAAPASRACALFLQRGGHGLRKLLENDRDIESICMALCPRDSVS